MTIIVARDGIMAADSACFANDLIVGHTKKITRLNDGCLIGLTGTSALILKLTAFLNDGGDVPTFPDDEMPCGLMLDVSGAIHKVEGVNVFIVECEYAASGAPMEMAYGALGAGASASEAVKVCIERHVWCGGTIQAEAIGSPLHAADAHLRPRAMQQAINSAWATY